MSKNDISMSVIRRLPRYYRFLSELDEQKVERISSNRLAQIMNVTASQVRQDLNCFGGFGQQGYGYSVSQLRLEIRRILGLNHRYQAVLLGAGNFGTAVAGYINFPKLGFELIGCFDTDKEKIGRSIGKLVIMGTALTPRYSASPSRMWKTRSKGSTGRASKATGISVILTSPPSTRTSWWRMST